MKITALSARLACLGLAASLFTGCSVVCAVKDRINETYERERDAGRRLFPDTKKECEKAKEKAENAQGSVQKLSQSARGAELASDVISELIINGEVLGEAGTLAQGDGEVAALAAQQCSANSVCSTIALCKSLGVTIPDGGRCAKASS